MLIRRPGGRGGPKPVAAPRAPQPKDWPHVVCVASGPSLTAQQGMDIAAARDRGWRVMVTNNTWQRIPTADVLYACDEAWWKMHHEAVEGFAGECWTASRWAAAKYHLHHAPTFAGAGLHANAYNTYSGSNSGHQLLNLAYHFAACDVVLVGYDMQPSYGMSHWHGDHPPELSQSMPYAAWVEGMEALCRDLQALGVSVVNASLETALVGPRRVSLQEALCL
jgi:hypothetical protein